MAQNYLITGYWGEPHVTAENDRGINAAIFGTGRFVLPVGEMFRAEYIGNNKIRMYDGKLLDNGAAAGIPAGSYVDFTIPEAGQGNERIDIIAFHYSKNLSTNVETGNFVVVSGTELPEGTDSLAPPALTQDDLLGVTATIDYMALWEIRVKGAVIGSPVQVFNTRFAGERIVTAYSEDGKSYTADLPGICNLYNGLEITVIFDIANTSNTVNLDLNGLGAKNVRVPLSFNTAALNAPDVGYFGAGRAVKLMFDGAYLAGKGAWKVVDRQKTSAQDLYGDVPVQSGGIVINTESADEDVATAKERIEQILGAENGVAALDETGRIPSENMSDSTVLVHNGSLQCSTSGVVCPFSAWQCGKLVIATFTLKGSTSNITVNTREEFNLAALGLPKRKESGVFENSTPSTPIIQGNGSIVGVCNIHNESLILLFDSAPSGFCSFYVVYFCE